MNAKRLSVPIAVFLCIGPIVFIWLYFLNPKRQSKELSGGDSIPSDIRLVAVQAGPKDPKELVSVGGVQRPKRDVEEKFKREGQEKRTLSFDLKAKRTGQHRLPAGEIPKVKSNAHPQVKMTHDAIREKVPGEASRKTSPFANIEAFDRRAFLKDPSSYLSEPVPSRVWDSAQPGANVPRLSRLSDRFVNMVQGETVRLQVKTEPKMPATFLSADCGAFSNRLATITVAADEKGTATAEFTATPGTFGEVNVLAASPAASGNVSFVVRISLPASSN